MRMGTPTPIIDMHIKYIVFLNPRNCNLIKEEKLNTDIKP